MKVLMTVLLVAIAIGVAPVFASEISAASPINDPMIVNEQSTAAVHASQVAGENEIGNISKIDLNVAVKPDTVANVENSTTSEPVKVNTTSIVPVQNVSNSTEVGSGVNSVKSGNSRELTVDEMKSIKGKGWVDDFQKIANTFIDGAVRIIGALCPGGGGQQNSTHSINGTNTTSTSFEFHL